MAENQQELDVYEAQDGSATVEMPEGMLNFYQDNVQQEPVEAKDEGGEANQADDDHPDDDEELRAAKRNRRRAKKDLIRKTNQEKEIRFQQLQRENEAMRQDIELLKRNTKTEQITRLEKGIDDANVRLEYAKMKLAEATQNQDGQAMVEAQMLWQSAQDEAKTLSQLKRNQEAELNRPQAPKVDPRMQRHLANFLEKHSWYDPNMRDPDSRLAKRIDETLAGEGYDPTQNEYWEEFDARLQKELPHRYNDSNDDESRDVRRPRNVVGSSGREASAAYGGTNRTQFFLTPERVKAMKEAGAWDNPVRKKAMVESFAKFDRENGRRN
jgi:hypothetical protein